ncbi:ribosome assembly RNA-binding protein YhbY [bacterium]|nr:ribosome assembly RNA-binding protein YhbY [bacterium]
MTALTGKQRRYLRSLANTLEPSVLIGKQGLSEGVLAKIDESLNAHELIKIRFLEFKDEKKELTETIVRATGASLAGLIGHVAILFRAASDPEKRSIVLPKGTS